MAPSRSRVVKGVVTPKTVLIGMVAVVALIIIALASSIVLTIINNIESEDILIDSVEDELIASSIAAREVLVDHMDFYNSINSKKDIDNNYDEWLSIVKELRALNDELGSAYIYVLKEIDDGYYFIFDTDPTIEEDGDYFAYYDLSPVHIEAFEGRASAGIMNVQDEWGSYNTGAIPLYDDNGKQVGIVATDIPDSFIEQNRSSAFFYTVCLVVVSGASVAIMIVILFMLIRRNARMQQHLFDLANFDPVSGLPNRNNLFTYLSNEIEHLQEHGHPFAALFVDLDNFKSVNDFAGHDAGDKLLAMIAQFLKEFAEQSEQVAHDNMDSITARIGGDEFLQLVPGISSKEEASEYASALLKAFASQDVLQQFIKEYGVGLSVGISLFPSMETDYDELIKCADIAMYHAKRGGKNNFCLYDISMGDDVEGVELSVRTKKK